MSPGDMRSHWRSMGCGQTPDGRLEVYGGDTLCPLEHCLHS